jgi:uncharacterized protein (TIGR02145 family)
MQYFFFVIICSFLFSSCLDSGTAPTTNTPEDTIETVTIGNQVWMAKNLNVATFQNGETIPEAKTAKEWAEADSLKKPAFCYYNFDPQNGIIYGKLYNWYAVSDTRGLAPKKFHVPNTDEWKILRNQYSSEGLKSPNRWKVDWGVGTNISGFNALPGGGCSNIGEFAYLEEGAYWWASTVHSDERATAFNIFKYQREMGDDDVFKGSGFSVRCIKD